MEETTMSKAEELVARANQLHAEILEKKKTRGIWMENFQSAAKRLGEMNKTLFEAENPSPDLIAMWKKEMAVVVDFQKQDPPKEPDVTEWMYAVEDARIEIAHEAGLRTRFD